MCAIAKALLTKEHFSRCVLHLTQKHYRAAWCSWRAASHLLCWRGQSVYVCTYMLDIARLKRYITPAGYSCSKRERRLAPRLQVWNPILDPNVALVEPWCHPPTLRPGGLVFKWILLTSLIRGWTSQLNTMWCNGKESGADQITALGKRAVRWCSAEMKSLKRHEQEEKEVQKQWRWPFTRTSICMVSGPFMFHFRAMYMHD